jgi:hypothetical protein
MFIRPCYKKSKGKRLAYWTLVESYRTPNGPRQRVVAYLGQFQESQRRGVKQSAENKGKSHFVQSKLFDGEQVESDWIEIDANAVRVENQKKFGKPWLALELIKLLKLDEFLDRKIPRGDADISWSLVSLILVICRFCNPSSEGCYLLRTNITDWNAEELWKAYIQLTDAESAFRIEKSDLRIRPIWHQKEERVLSPILVCFISYVLWKTLGQLVKSAGLGDEPRRVLDELGEISLVDVILPTKSAVEIRKRCITRPRPTEHQQILLQ